MIGAALLVARGVIPPDSIAAALQLPCKFFFPMVPAEGLYLKYAGFGRNGDRVSAQLFSACLLGGHCVLTLDRVCVCRWG